MQQYIKIVLHLRHGTTKKHEQNEQKTVQDIG